MQVVIDAAKVAVVAMTEINEGSRRLVTGAGRQEWGKL